MSKSYVPASQLLRAYDVYCPKYEELREADTHSAEYMRVEQENQVWSLCLFGSVLSSFVYISVFVLWPLLLKYVAVVL